MSTTNPPRGRGSEAGDTGERNCAAPTAAPDRCRRSDSGLPGARQAGPLHRVFNAQAGFAAFGMRAKAARNRVQERADDLNVRMRAGNLRFDPIDRLEHVVLITARESERTDRVVHGRQSLVYFCQLLGIHGRTVDLAFAARKRGDCGRTLTHCSAAPLARVEQADVACES